MVSLSTNEAVRIFLGGDYDDISKTDVLLSNDSYVITADPDDGVLTPGDDVTVTVTADGFTGDFELVTGTMTYAGVTPEGYLVFDTLLGGSADVIMGDGVVADYANSPSPLIGGLHFDDDPVTGAVALCFLAGTRIATPQGEVAVETLAIGDKVLTADGRAVPVKWLGRQTLSSLFTPAERLMPVRFAAGSLGNGLPHSDLTVTTDHAMLVDGILCHAAALVNGSTITRVPLSEMGQRFTVYHVETEEHEIIFANGAPAETFIDNVSRRAFDNFAEFEDLYGDVAEMSELPYPRAMSARQVPAVIRALLENRTAA